MEKNLDEIYRGIYQIAVDTWCSDNPEVKRLALNYNAAVSEEARRLHEEAIVIDNCSFGLESGDDNWQLDESGLTAMNCTVTGIMDNTAAAINNFILYHSVIAESENLIMVEHADDILRAKRENKKGVIFGAQSCEFIQHDDLDASVEVFAKMGLRVMQIGYNHRTFAADGCHSGDDAGITKDGRKLIRAMEKHGVQVDLSHAGRRSTLEAMDICEKAPIFSHSNPKELFDHVRNISPEQAKKCAERGGVIGACTYNLTLWNKRDFPSIDHFIDIICYYADLVGAEHVGIGFDCTAQAGTYVRREQQYFVNLVKENDGENSLYYKSYQAGRGVLTMYTEGLLNISNMICITDQLLKRGFNKEEVKMIIGGNWYRVFKENWK